MLVFFRILAVAVCIAPGPLYAAIQTYDFHGLSPIGEDLFGTISWDTSAVPSDPDRGYYDPAPGYLEISAGGQNIFYEGSDFYIILGPGAMNLEAVKFEAAFTFNLLGTDPSVFGSPPRLPSRPLKESDFDHSITARFVPFAPPNSPAINFQLDSFVLRERRPQTHILSIAISDSLADEGHRLSNAAAQIVADEFDRLNGVDYVRALPMSDENSIFKNNKEDIKNAIEEMRLNLQPGDNFVLYIGTHGNFDRTKDSGIGIGDEPPVDIQYNPDDLDQKVTNTGDEALYVQNSTFDRRLSDDEMHDIFDTPEWDEINKLFILDACNSGGFWNDDPALTTDPPLRDDTGDLSTLKRAALLAAAPESNYGYAGIKDGDMLGFLAQALELTLKGMDANAAIDFEQLSIDTLINSNLLLYTSQIENRPVYLTDENQWGAPIILTEVPDSISAYQTEDFSFHIVAPADFDQNGVVDGEDLSIWKGGFGLVDTAHPADADGDNDVDGNDFLIWQRNLGSGAAPESVTVPEMPSIRLAIGALALLGYRNQRRKS